MKISVNIKFKKGYKNMVSKTLNWPNKVTMGYQTRIK